MPKWARSCSAARSHNGIAVPSFAAAWRDPAAGRRRPAAKWSALRLAAITRRSKFAKKKRRGTFSPLEAVKNGPTRAFPTRMTAWLYAVGGGASRSLADR